MDLLHIIQEFCLRTSLPKPVLVAASSDDQVLQIMALANEVLDNLGERKAWQALQKTATHTTLAQEDQGALTAICDAGFRSLKDNLLFNRTDSQLIFGPTASDAWQAHKATIYTISQTEFRILQNHLHLIPALAAGKTIAFEYLSEYPVLDSTNAAKVYFTADTDTSLYPTKLLILGLRWIWKREKGIRYGEEFRQFEAAVANFAGKDGGNPTINLADEPLIGPQINIPGQSWEL